MTNYLNVKRQVVLGAREDIQRNRGYKEELLEYTDNTINYLYFLDFTFGSMEENKDHPEIFTEVFKRISNDCISCEYTGNKTILPNKLRDEVIYLEELAIKLSYLLYRNGELISNYESLDQVERLIEIKEVNSQAYEIRELIEALCIRIQERIN